MRLTRPGADHTPEGLEPNTSEKDCATVDSGDAANSAHLAEASGHPLGRDVVHPRADAGLGARKVLQPPRCAQDRYDLYVKARHVTSLVDGRLVPAGDVGQRDRRTTGCVVEAVQTPQQVEIDVCK